MSHDEKVGIPRLATGVPGLDAVLGGGLPELSFNIVAGAPGTGKTTLAHQIVFANATPARPALYFTVLGEPAIKMLRYQQQFQFFDPAKVGAAIRFINLSQVVLEQELTAVLEAISREVEAATPAFFVVDSFRTLIRKAGRPRRPKSSSRRLCSGSRSTSPAGRPRRFCSGSMAKKSSAAIPSSPSRMASTG